MPTGVYKREGPIRLSPAPPSFDALAASVRSVSDARRARKRGLLGSRPALQESLRGLAAVATALADSESI